MKFDFFIILITKSKKISPNIIIQYSFFIYLCNHNFLIMRKILYTFLLVASAMTYAQSKNQPVVLVDGMLASNSLIAGDKKNIQSTKVFKTAANLPQNLKSFEGLASNGIISASVKENYYDRISLEGLNQQFKLNAENTVYFDGQPIKDTTIQVLGNVLEHMEVREKDGQKFLYIFTTPQVSSENALK